MIVREYPTIWKLFFINKGSIVTMIRFRLLIIFLLALLATIVNYYWPGVFTSVHLGYFTMVGLALSLFLGFRNNTAYERWWEGRSIWGALVKESRSVARTCRSVLDHEKEAEVIAQIERWLIVFPIALRHQCQYTRMDEDIKTRLLPDEAAKILNKLNPANLILLELSMLFGQLYRQDKISDVIYKTLDNKLDNMNLIQAGCERLNKTPIPFAYNLLLQRTAVLYCALLPFGLVLHANWATAPLSLIIAYTFFGLDALDRDLEDPFSKRANSLPLKAICIGIERVIMDMQGKSKRQMPRLPKIHHFILE